MDRSQELFLETGTPELSYGTDVGSEREEKVRMTPQLGS